MSKNLIFGEKAKLISFRLYSWEKALVKAYIKVLREKKKKEIEENELRTGNTKNKR